MHSGMYDHGYGRDWTDVLVHHREGYTTSVADYHSHDFYEINLIFSGNIHILLPNETVETNCSHIILTAPGTPHFIACKPDTLYSRLYLSFSAQFVEDFIPQWVQLRQLFGENGRIVAISKSQRELCQTVIDRIRAEDSPLRQRLLICYLLSHIGDFAKESRIRSQPTPSYVAEALSYINQHYGEKIVASQLAQRLHIGRTTLMTGFREYTGSSLNSYLVQYRLKQALRLLQSGVSVQAAAEQCGFADSSGLIRSFKRSYGMSPCKYLQSSGD